LLRQRRFALQAQQPAEDAIERQHGEGENRGEEQGGGPLACPVLQPSCGRRHQTVANVKPCEGQAHARYAVFQMAEVAVPRHLFRRILDMIDDLPPREPTSC